MHHALELDEILLNIFAYCNPPGFKNSKYLPPLSATADLVALARTCRIFKEPALDILWSELSDLAPLARCLPEISYQLAPGFKVSSRCFSSRFNGCKHLAIALRSGIHLTDRSNKLSGILFEVTRVACDPYWILEVHSTPTVSERT